MNAPTTVVGQLLETPELRRSKRDVPYVRARIVEKTPSEPGNWKSDLIARFLNVIAFGSTSENLCASATKGDRIIVTGQLERDDWEDKGGKVHEGEKIVAESVGIDLRFATAQITRTRRGDDR